ncbi:hypothetical protein ABL840_04050 [Variovorax sp. NFACC27]|uniref:hypothetical protein n=1 Tax=unclassified Variovorax TaxID=663243 RepID=UPI000894D350|nr:hypothetical protein SAMN03159371_02471 [Variovorax sp. NFACC28]SEG53793.1 hypothetical protein SAMN03159365_02552 [Variovorax sp. NFACC29]SFC15307.1 hypothetical protein SAMN03159379_01558 [Variovorax sp. NFACC26]SFH10369.1 hypothetical protein SAMN03159447_06643 [Variovorax sp. NFACC27]
MSGSDVSSSEHYSGPLLLEVTPAQGPADAIEAAQQRLRNFIDGIGAGFFFPARLRPSAPLELRVAGASVHGRVEVDDLPVTALGVLAGMLADERHRDVFVQSARAVLGQREFDLLIDSGERPAMPESPPFEVEFPEDMGGNYALLVEIEFVHPVPTDVGQQLLSSLALWDALVPAYPLDPDVPVEAGGAQAMFNDPRTIHYHEWIWDNADAGAWSLIVNLCCAWHETLPIVRLHFE